MTRFVRLLAVALCALAAPAAVGAQGFTVVVNSSNPATSLSKDAVSQMLLKQTVSWPTGEKVAPVDLGKDAAARQAFSKAVHGRAVSAVVAYWQTQIFSGKAAPPPTRSSDAEVIARQQ
jgi:hypothetical protein